MKITLNRKCFGFTPASVKFGGIQLFYLLAIAGFLTGCAGTNTLVYRNPSFVQNKSYRVAVIPFRDATGSAGSGETLSSIFETTLLASGKIEVVERGELDRIIQERHPEKLGATSGAASGIVISEESKTNATTVSIHPEHPDYGSEFEDPVAIGKLVRADLVIVGKVTSWTQGWQRLTSDRHTTVAASVKAISVEKGIVVWSLDKETEATLFTDGIPVDGPVDAVARKLCRQMVASFVGK